MDKATIYSRRKHRSAVSPVHKYSTAFCWKELGVSINNYLSTQFWGEWKNFQSSLRFFTATLIVHTHTRLLKFAFGKSDAVHVICFRRLLGWVDFDNLSCTRGWRFKNKWPSRPSSVSRMCVYVSVGSAETVSAFWSAFVNLLVVHSVSTQ